MPRTPGDVLARPLNRGPRRLGPAGLAEAARLLEEARDALELAIVAGAPSELVDRLALAVGLSSAIIDLSGDCPPLAALTSSTLERGEIALDAWRTWQRGFSLTG